MSVTRVAIVDDQQLFRRGTLAALQGHHDLDVVADVEHHDSAVQEVVAAGPDVVVLGELSGGWYVFAMALRRQLPNVGFVVLLDRVSEEDLFYALRAGACACRPRTITRDDLVEVVRQAARGDCVIHMADVTTVGPSRRIVAGTGIGSDRTYEEPATPNPLSEREMEILAGVAEGCSNKEIGERCGISDQTVKNHLTTVLRKLSVTDRTEAVVMALRHRWLKLEQIKIRSAA